MPKRLAILLLLGLAMAVCALDAQAQFNIIPKPQKITAGSGSFMLDRHATIAAPADRRAAGDAADGVGISHPAAADAADGGEC